MGHQPTQENLAIRGRIPALRIYCRIGGSFYGKQKKTQNVCGEVVLLSFSGYPSVWCEKNREPPGTFLEERRCPGWVKHAPLPGRHPSWAEIPWGLVYYRHLSLAITGSNIKQNNSYCVRRSFLHSFGYDLRRSLITQVWTSSYETKKPGSWNQKMWILQGTMNYRWPCSRRWVLVSSWSRGCWTEQGWCCVGIPSHPVGCTGILEQCAPFWAPHTMRNIDKLGQLQSTMTVTTMSEQKLTLLKNAWRNSHGFLSWNTQTWAKMYVFIFIFLFEV